MTMNRRWTLPLVLAVGAAIGAALTLGRRAARHDARKQQHTERCWPGKARAATWPDTGNS